LYVNYFQPSFKLKSKERESAKVIKKYHLPATPYERLLASDRVADQCKDELRRIFATLDPVALLNQIREVQRNLSQHEGMSNGKGGAKENLTDFVASLSTAWRNGEVRPTHRKPCTGPRTWRTRPDPFQDAWPLVEKWLNEQPDATAKGLFQRLQQGAQTRFAPGQLRTLQRRVREWRTAIARRLVLGADIDSEDPTAISKPEPCV